MSKLLHHQLQESVLLKSREGKFFLSYNDVTLALPDNVLEDVKLSDDHIATLKLTVDFGFKKQKGIYKVERSSSKDNSIIIHDDLEISFQDSKLNFNEENPLFVLYQLNASTEVDSILLDMIDILLSQGVFNDQIKEFDDNWTEEEAKIAFAIYKMSKKLDPIDVDHNIDELIKRGKIDRTKGAIKFKLSNFKNLETGGDEGLDHIGQVFIKVFNESK